MEILIIVWLALAIVIGSIASGRGRSGFGWFLLALLVSPLLAAVLLLLVGPGKGTGGALICSACGGHVSPQFSVCRHCGRDLKSPRPLNEFTRGNRRSGRKTCSACGTVVNRDALVCEGCGRDFERSPATPTAAKPPVAEPTIGQAVIAGEELQRVAAERVRAAVKGRREPTL